MFSAGAERRSLAALVVLAGLSALYCLTPIHNANFFWHLRNGSDILETGTVRTADPFTHTMCGREWLQQEWGAEVAIALAWKLGGEAGPILLKTLAVAAAVLLAGLQARRRGADWQALAAVGTVWLSLSFPRWIARPHVATILFFALYLFTVPRMRKRRLWKAFALFMPLQIVWANCHAGFIMGPFLLGLPVLDDLFARRWRRAAGWASLSLSSLAVSMVHPNTTGSLRYLTGFLSRPLYRQTIREWWSPFDPRYQPGLPISRTALILVVLSVLAVIIMVRRRREVRPSHVAGIALLSLASATAARNVELLSLAGLAWLAPLVRGRVRTWIALPLLALAAVVPPLIGIPREVGPSRSPSLSVDWSIYPRDAADFLESHPELLEGRLFNTHEIAGYLEYRFGGRLPLYVDGRCLLYPQSFYAEYLALASPLDREAALPVQAHALEARDIDLAIVNWPSSSGSVAYLLADLPFWKPVYWDRLVVIYAREDLLRGNGVDSLALSKVDPLRLEDLLASPPYRHSQLLEAELARAFRMGSGRAGVLLALLKQASGDSEGARATAGEIPDPDIRARLGEALDPACTLRIDADPLSATAACWSRAAAGETEAALDAARLSEDPILVAATEVLAGRPPTGTAVLPWVLPSGMEALEADSASTEAMSARASALWCCGMRDSALRESSGALELGAAVPWQTASAAIVNSMAGEIETGLVLALRAREARTTPFTLYAHGRVLQEAGRDDEALDPLLEALRLSPGYQEAALALAESLWSLGRVSSAVEIYSMLLSRECPLPPSAGRRMELARSVGGAFLDRMAARVKDSGAQVQ